MVNISKPLILTISQKFFLIALQLIKLSAQFLVAQQSRSELDEGHVAVASRVSQKNTDPRATRHPSPGKEYHVSRKMRVGPIVGRQEKALRIYVITRCRVTANKYSTSLVPSWPCFFEPMDHHQKLNTITNDVNIEKCQDVI